MDHVIALIDNSKFCKQFLRWECKGAVIHNPHQKDSWTTFWTNRSSEFNQFNTPATYFPGAKPGSGNCACGDTGTCANASLSCNCDKNDFEWRSDEGFIIYKDDLPILAFRAGDTGETKYFIGSKDNLFYLIFLKFLVSSVEVNNSIKFQEYGIN